MAHAALPSLEIERLLASEIAYRLLSTALRAPLPEHGELLWTPGDLKLACQATEALRHEPPPGELGFGEARTESFTLVELARELLRKDSDLVAEHVRVFGLTPCRECSPYETDFHANEDPFFRSQQMADAAGFYRAFGVQPGGQRRERPDHIALELEFMAFLLAKQRLAADRPDRLSVEHIDICRQAQQAFLRDHLAWWAPAFAQLLLRKAGQGPLALAASALCAFLPLERCRLGVAPFQSLVAPRPSEPVGEECAGCSLAHST